MDALAAQPGFRRRFIITPSAGSVRAAVEDDYHCMAVTIRHDGTTILAVSAEMDRAPWTTCPGAMAVIARTFTGVTLSEAARRGDKPANCTHLYDLAVLAAAHSGDAVPSAFDILATDPVDGKVTAEIRQNGAPLLRLVHHDNVLIEPTSAAGASLFKLRAWIEALPAEPQEAARLLQWGSILAQGRTYPLELQSDATRMPANCYTFQEAQKQVAQRVGAVFDFSQEAREPLEHLGENGFGRRG